MNELKYFKKDVEQTAGDVRALLDTMSTALIEYATDIPKDLRCNIWNEIKIINACVYDMIRRCNETS